ncbi:sulfotransferase [Gracilimonas sp.]|uniref:sulfotransferase n=1 Tax=Gracilimonas sp. TaxID=1974203 RepID=UPI0032EAC83F
MSLSKLKINIQSWLLRPFEIILRSWPEKQRSIKPVWIIGAPRSGTTLTYQLFCSFFKTSYLTNRVAERYRIALISRFFERIFFSKSLNPKSFKSKFGKTHSPNDPHEGGAFFYQFFPVEEPSAESLGINKRKKFRKLIQRLAYPSELFVSKNTVHSLRIKALADAFPESQFIWVTRDKADTAYSILKARVSQKIDTKEWWGVKPPGWQERIGLTEKKRVLWQISEVETIIEKDLMKTNRPFFKVSYKDVCEKPHKVMNEIAKEFGLNDYISKDDDFIPDSFNYSTSPKDSLAEEIRILVQN